ncbi:MAG: sugar ABC transporter permease [Pseudomonadota bacterium]
MTTAPRPAHTSLDVKGSPFARFVAATEIDTRLLGMAGALLLIWFGFHFYGVIFKGEGFFLTPRNLWNLSVQMCSIGVMATGMVLVIVTRNIDLSVGSLLGFIGMVMGLLQVEWLPPVMGLGHPAIWMITVVVGLCLGVLIGTLNGVLIAYLAIPSFIVTLGGLMAWRGAAFLMANGRTISPVDATFQLLGGGPYGSIGSTGSWVIGIIACLAVLYGLVAGRKNRRKHDFPQRPIWAEVFMGALGCGLILGAVLVVDSYYWPKGIVKAYAAANNITVPPEGLFISLGFAYPVLILVTVALLMTVLMTRTRFGRYVFAIGGNPEAAALSGINVRWMTVKIYALMGMLAGLSAVISSARLTSATNALGQTDELYVIAAAVIGGTSLAGGVGTIYGAVLGALVMESLRTGMVLIGFDTAVQNIVVGLVLIVAVYLDILYRKRTK